MRLIDADNYKGKIIASHCYSGVSKLIRTDDVLTVNVNDLIIAQFKKMRAEIDEYMITSCCEDDDIKCIRQIIDEHISELSGENKQSRCNSCQNNTDELSGECYECVKGIEDWYEPLEENKE